MADRQELNDDAKVFIVQALACFDTPSIVAAAVKEEFDGLIISRQAVQAYDPTKKAGSALSKKLTAIFKKTRRKFLKDTSDIGVAQKSARLRMLDRAARLAETRGNIMGMAELLQNAAKEMGNAFTNKRELSGVDGGPIVTKRADELSDDELRRIAAGSRNRVAAKAPGEGEPAGLRAGGGSAGTADQ